MCRMIAAAGRFSVKPLIAGLRTMASNRNPAYRHEFSVRGSAFVHDDGWGAVWRHGDALAATRRERPCFDDPALDELVGLRTDGLLLHARRGTGDAGVGPENTHPFVHALSGVQWAYCHNGTVRDVASLRRLPDAVPLGGTDSERLFHHLLAGHDPGDPLGSLASSLDAVRDFTCLNGFLLSPCDLFFLARAEPGTERPAYYTLWRGVGDGFALVSSEPLPGVEVEWQPVTSAVAALTAAG